MKRKRVMLEINTKRTETNTQMIEATKLGGGKKSICRGD
jgi:hypothetical protein